MNQTANHWLMSLMYFEQFEIGRWYEYAQHNSQLEAHCSTVEPQAKLVQWVHSAQQSVRGTFSRFANGTLTWFLFLKLRHYSHLVVVNGSEELSLRKSAFSHRSHYLGKRQQCVMFDYEVGILVAVRIFNPDCHAAWFNAEFVVVP